MINSIKKDQLAPISKRVLSVFIDFIFFWIAIAIFAYFFGESLANKVDSEGNTTSFGYSLSGSKLFYVLLLWVVMFPVIEGLTGYTPAKKLLKLRVLKKNYSRVSIVNSFVRHLLDPIDLFFLIGFIIAANNKYKQRLGDILGSTIVIDEKQSTN